jgi:hypothetical protein
MSQIISDRPFVLMMHLVLADHRGDYQKAAESQRRLAELGWFVSRKPPEQPAKPKRRRSRPAAGEVVAE